MSPESRKARALFLRLRRAEGRDRFDLVTNERKAKQLHGDKVPKRSVQDIWGMQALDDGFWDDDLQRMWLGFEEAYLLAQAELAKAHEYGYQYRQERNRAEAELAALKDRVDRDAVRYRFARALENDCWMLNTLQRVSGVELDLAIDAAPSQEGVERMSKPKFKMTVDECLEFNDACSTAAHHCPQYRGLDTVEDRDICRRTISAKDLVKQWKKSETLWKYGYSEELSLDALEVFEKYKAYRTALKFWKLQQKELSE